MIGIAEGLFLMIPLAGLVLGALALVQYVQKQSGSRSPDSRSETERLEAQVESLQNEIERLRERQDFVEKLRSPDQSDRRL